MTQKPQLTADGEWRCETIRHMGRRCRDWDYTARCIYEITVVLKDRRKDWLGVLARSKDGAGGAVSCANSGKGGPCEWVIEPTADGRAVVEALLEMPKRYPQNKGFSRLQKPSGRYFDACASGKLLMLAPSAWPFVPGEKKMTRFDATALNRLCQWIADDGAAEINYKGMKPTDINELALAAVR